MSAVVSQMTIQEVPTAAGLPLIGNALTFMAAKGIPIEFLQESAQKYGDIVQFKVANQSLYLLTHPDMAHEVLVKRVTEFRKTGHKDGKQQTLARFLGNGILTADYEEWKPQRKLIQPLMHSQTINKYAETMVRFGEKLLASWENGSSRNIHADMMQVTMWIIAETMFGMDVTQTPELETAGHAAQAIAIADVTAPLPDWLTKGRDKEAEKINEVLTKLVARFVGEHERRQGEERHDLLSLLLETRDENGNPMDDEFIRNNILTLFFAGHETTANTLTWVFYYLDQNPEVAVKLYHELDTVLAGRTPNLDDLPNLPYTLMVIKETMRIEPTVAAIPRLIYEDTVLQNYRLKAGSVVLVSPYVMHHDSRWWTNPERFEPERFSAENEAQIHKYAYLPFGGGPRICIGNHFALMEAQLLLAVIASHYRLKLNQPEVKRLRQVTTSPENGLMMRLEAR